MKKIQILIVTVLIGCIQNNNRDDSPPSDLLNSRQSDIKNLRLEATSKFKAKSYEAALVAYDDLVKLDSLNGEVFFHRARCLMNLGKFEESVNGYLKSSELDYRVEDCYYNIGTIYNVLILNDSLALYYFEKALEENSRSLEIKEIIKSIHKSQEGINK